LKRTALLIKELAGGTVSSEITDVYPEPAEDFKVRVSYKNINRLTGKDIGEDTIKKILISLEIKIDNEDASGLDLLVPPYRVDVTREADVIEEILRIYGYNNIDTPEQIKASLQYSEQPEKNQLRNLIAGMLAAQGFNEIWSNSLTKASYYDDLENYNSEQTVRLLNPLSNDLNGMRQTLMFGGLECIVYNINRQNRDLKLFEFGNCYFKRNIHAKDDPASGYREEEHLSLFISGNSEPESWLEKPKEASFYQIKTFAENILKRLGFVHDNMKVNDSDNELFSDGLTYLSDNRVILELGIVSETLLKQFEIETPVFCADFNWEYLHAGQKTREVVFEKLPKFPAVRRDLALLIDKDVKFGDIRDLAFKIERNILREVGLFDVYEGKGIPEDKKSYALSFILRDDKRTLKDKHIEKTMTKFVNAFKREFDAGLR